MPQTSLALYMQAQRDLYLARLPGRVAELETALDEFCRTGAADTALAAAAHAHQLSGSGGTFGFPAISEAAAGIEKLLASAASARRTLDAPAQAQLQAGLAVLKAPPASLAFKARTAPNRETGRTARPTPVQRHKPAHRVLILDPDPQLAAQLAEQLKRCGYLPQTLADPGQLALQEIPSALIANMTFCADPRLVSFVATPAQPGSPGCILVLTGGGSPFPSRLAAVRAGAQGYFPDPLDTVALMALLDHLTSGEPDRPYRVLIVDDDASLAAFYAGVLKSAGMLTCVVTEPERIMAPLLDFKPDLITCDIHMPQCSGIELAAVIRQQQEFVRIPIVFLSAETSLDKQAQALRQGGDDFILKPVQPAALVAAAQSRARRYRAVRAAEDTLRISEERFRLVFQTSLDGFIQSLADGTVVSANQAACAMFGMTEPQIRSAGIAGLVDPTDARLAGMVRESARRGEFRGELTCVRADGTRFPVEVSSSRHTGSQGEVQVSVILRDITERKLAEQQIIDLNTGLEARVERRTAELMEAHQELQAFSHSLAHDLRQPYIAINGLTSLLERDLGAGASERSRNYLQRIRAGVNQMNERTDSLLALAQLSRTHIRREPVDLALMSREIVRALEQQDPQRRVHTDIQQPLPADADAGLVRHLLKILLGNAWKFSAGVQDARITLGKSMGAAGEDVFVVKDNGAGFDMAYADRLFGAFQRLHAPEDFPGAGIGLAMARRIVTRHGGSIRAESGVGEGACFYFTLAPTGPEP